MRQGVARPRLPEREAWGIWSDTESWVGHTKHCADPWPIQTPTILILIFFLVVTLCDLEVAPVPHEPACLWALRPRKQVPKPLDILGLP